MTKKTEPRWNFYRSKSPNGYVYLIASQSVWVPEKKQPRIIARHHVGRLNEETLAVKPGKAFLEKFPQYNGKELFYFHNSLLTPEELQAHPNYEEYQSFIQVEEEDEELLRQEFRQSSYDFAPYRQCGRSWLAWSHLKLNGILDDLCEIFGKEDGTLLAQLAAYTFVSRSGAIQNFEDWALCQYMPGLKPISGQRLSEVLSKVQRTHMDAFYKRRHEKALSRARTAQEKALTQYPHLKNSPLLPPLQLAFDSTSISTYSDSILDAEWGKNKQDESLKQINLCLVADQVSHEVLYAHEYQGSINDVSSFTPILTCMRDAGFDLTDTLLVADRGYKSMYNIQHLINENIRFVMGVPLTEDMIKKKFEDHADALNDWTHYDSDLNVFAYTPASNKEHETWKQTLPGGCGTVRQRVYLHLYRNVEIQKTFHRLYTEEVKKIVAMKNEGLQCPAERWKKYRRYVQVRQKKVDNKIFDEYVPDMTAIAKAVEFAGYFCIRTNALLSASETLKLYRQRQSIEDAFRRFKVDNQSSRLRATNTAYLGKLFVYLLAESIRMMLGTMARANGQSLPGNSLEKYLSRIDGVVARQRGRKWRVDLLSTRQKEVFERLGAPIPRGNLI